MRSGKKFFLGLIQLLTGASVDDISDDTALSGDSSSSLVTEHAVKTYVDENAVSSASVDNFTTEIVSGKIKIKDRIELNTMLNAFRLQVQNSLSVLNMTDGVTDEFEDETGIDQDTGQSENYQYESTADYYTPDRTIAGIDENTLLALKGNSSLNNSTGVIDSGNTGHVITASSAQNMKFSYGKSELGRGSWRGMNGEFNGSSSYLSVPDHADWDIFSQTNFTIDFWIRFTGSAITKLLSQYESSTDRWGVHLGATGIVYLLQITGNVINLTLGANCSLEDRQWHHVAIIKVGNEYGIYKDGTQTDYLNNSSTDTYAGILYIGQQGNSGQYLSGAVDELRITHNNAFSASPVDLSATGIGSATGNPMRWKVTTHNTKDIKLHGVGLTWD